MKLIFLLSLLFINNTFALSSKDYEVKYYSSYNYIMGFDSNIMADFIWDQDADKNFAYVEKALEQFQAFSLLDLNLASKLRILYLSDKYKISLTSLKENIIDLISVSFDNDLKTAILLNNYRKKFSIIIGAKYVNNYLNSYSSLIANIERSQGVNSVISKNEVQDLFYRSPKLENNGSKLFMFCRVNRKFPCLFLLKDSQDELVLNEDGTVWSQNALASSKHDYLSNRRNGETPTGIFKINSVMPKANKKLVYGKYRRFILEFIAKSRNEISFRSYLPKSSWDSSWWQANIIARDMGRNLFRIHGTGLRNSKPLSPYYPFVRTSGCVAQKENKYQGVRYKEQRLLLDRFMKSMGLSPSYANEPKVQGLLYVMNINSKEKIVVLDDVKALLNL